MITASVTGSPKKSSAVFFIFFNTSAEICGGASLSPFTFTHASPLSALVISNGIMSISRFTSASSKRRPIKRLIANKVFLGLVTAWRFAGWPTKISLSFV